MKKGIALLLSVAMILSLCVTAFAEQPQKLVMLGDSIAWGTGVYNSEEACYGRIVANTNGYEYANYAVDGTRSWDLLEKIEVPEVKQSVETADIINISIGGNDYLQQNLLVIVPEVLLGIDENMDNIEEDFGEYFAQIIERIKELNPEVTIIVNTLYNPEKLLLGYIYGQAVMRVNRQINAYHDAHSEDFVLMDVSDVMANPMCVAADTIHPSAVGNEVIAGVMLKTLYNLGLGENLEPVIVTKGIDEIPYTSYILRFIRMLFTPSFKAA